jgi:hypothetical protein
LPGDGAGAERYFPHSNPIHLTKDKGGIFAYNLTPAAVRRLRGSGVRSGGKFPASILASLIRSGDAYSAQLADAQGQAFLFTDDDIVDSLPRCEITGSVADLHLVVYGEGLGTVAKLLAREPRFLLQSVTILSIPIWSLGTAALDQLETTGKMPKGSDAAKALRQWFRRDYDEAWAKLRRSHAQQESLDIGPAEGELPLAKSE